MSGQKRIEKYSVLCLQKSWVTWSEQFQGSDVITWLDLVGHGLKNRVKVDFFSKRSEYEGEENA